jgi:hypothetical protein
MNSIVKGALVFIAGAAVGTFGGALLTKKKYEDMANEEIDLMREALREARDMAKQIVKDAEGLGEISAVSGEEVPAKKERRTQRQAERTEYRGLVKDYVKDMSGDEAEEEVYRASQSSRKEVSDGPYVITYDAYNLENDHYDKSTIYYYEDDDTLADENDEVIGDVFGVIGDDALSSFGEGSNDPEVVYVRNDKMQIDYEVIRLSKSYGETVMGYTNEEGGR